MNRKNRYSFKKVCFWVTLVNGIMLGLSLWIIYYVKNPYQSLDLTQFSLARYILRGAVSIAFQCVFDYFVLNQYYRLMAKKAEWPSYLMWTLIFLLSSLAYYMLNDLTIRKEEFKVVFDISLKLFSYSIAAIFQIALPLVFAAITRQLDEKKWQAENQKVLEQRTSRLEKEKMQADYLFLKAQINPHFLHNTLNFLYARSLPYSSELSEGILTLSEIMRYSLDKEEDTDGKVLLTREIEHVHNIIKIQQLRFGNALQVAFTIQGNPEDLRILPFVLITLVENAFKHGDLKNADHPVTIDLCIDDGKKLRFRCVNKKKTGPKELSTGIGLENTRKRLELAYGENYSLYIKDQREAYIADLSINL
ncbi:histidine kinase [Flavitalea sp. BT771]|uniref:sensor histidine kinase n=1 Tax=Flavitalea sp. BT771 TaxID=3063329 RepID=UPI0026E344ED|nr:histidine kinase [Flavitalea sp. BT771]MDO6434942.1 histidine kinase [Flavitalea sp. BT771]MDV6223842.1 histidine kinase [Flavitalea sp. BT771]